MATGEDVYSLVIFANCCNQPVENVLHFRDDNSNGTTPQIQAEDLVTIWEADFESEWLDCLPDNYELIGYKARRVNNTGGPTFQKPKTGNGTRGDAGSSALGPCVISSYYDGTNWRSGRIFLPGIAEADITNNQPAAGLVAAVAALEVPLLAPQTGGGAPSTMQYCIFKPSAPPNQTNGAGFYFFPVQATFSGKMGVQNRRLRPTF